MFEVDADDSSISFTVTDHCDGTYGVTYTPTGPHVDISIRLHGKHIQNSPFSLVIPTLTLSQPSLILSVQLAKRLAAMLPVNHQTLTRLGICQDGTTFTSSYFWRLVEDKGGIIVIVRNTNKHVFGGFVQDVYTPRDYEHRWIPGHVSNFVFTLGSSTSPAVKLLKTSPSDGHGVVMGSGSALVMGAGRDLCVESGGYFFCTTPKTYTTIAPGYPAVPLDNTLLAGSRDWVPEVIEVWMCT